MSQSHLKIMNRKRAQIAARSGRVVAGEMLLWVCALSIVVTSAIWTKERGSLPALAQVVNETPATQPGVDSRLQTVAATTQIDEESIASAIESDPNAESASPRIHPASQETPEDNLSIRWFDGKPVRPARTIYMTVTGYSPDARSCGKYADGKTAIMYSVWTNGMNLVAADPKVLPYWSMISVPGYAGDDIVPVMDCGGAIKGNRLDLLYPTHELALQWGVRQMPVTVWEFVDEE